jgi:hypothetical protein
MSSFSISMLAPSVITGNASNAQSTRIFDNSSKLCFPGRNTTDTGIIGVPHDSVVGETAGCDDPSNRIDVYNETVVPKCVLGGRMCYTEGIQGEMSGSYDTMIGIIGNRSGESLNRPTGAEYSQLMAQQKMKSSQFKSAGGMGGLGNDPIVSTMNRQY